MKKIISIALVCMMLLSAIAVVASADEKYKGDPEHGNGLVSEVTAYALPVAPTFDFDEKGNPTNTTLLEKGEIDTSVWGEPTVIAKASDANNAFTNEPNSNVLFAFERAFDEAYKEDKDAALAAGYSENGAWKDISFKLWLAWDNDYYYVAAEIDDPDGYSLKSGGSSVWDGDCLQFMVDPLGPNGVMKYADFNYDYKTQCFDWWSYKRPWYNLNTVMNLGVGEISTLKRNRYQVVNMADDEAGTVISDPKTNRGVKLNIVNANLNKEQNNKDKTVIQVAIPWNEILKTASYAGNISETNIGAGYVLGMSASVLNGAANDASEYKGSWNSYLNWGSGVTGASMETSAPWFPYNNPGSNAVVLSGKSALDHEADVDGIKVAEPIQPIEHIDQLLFSDLGDSDNQLPTTDDMTYNVETGIAAALDMAIVAVDPTDDSRSLVGWWIGDGYSVYAGYDISTKQFIVAEQNAGEGINRDKIYGRSPLTYNWQIADTANDIPAEWHRLGIKIVGDNVKLYFDGAEVLDITHERIGHHIVGEQEAMDDPSLTVGQVTDSLINQVFVLNNTAACVFDNYIAGSADYNLKGDDNNDGALDEAKATSFLFKFTFDSDDPAWNASAMRQAEKQRIDYTPNDKESDAYYAEKGSAVHNHTMEKVEAKPATKDADGNKEYWVCSGCGKLFADEAGTTEITADDVVVKYVLVGDINGDSKITARDVIALMKQVLKGDVPATNLNDINNDGKITARDVIALMKLVLKGGN